MSVKARVFWDNNTDSIEISVSHDENAVSYLSRNLPKNFYTFIRTDGALRNAPVRVESPGLVDEKIYKSRFWSAP